MDQAKSRFLVAPNIIMRLIRRITLAAVNCITPTIPHHINIKQIMAKPLNTPLSFIFMRCLETLCPLRISIIINATVPITQNKEKKRERPPGPKNSNFFAVVHTRHDSKTKAPPLSNKKMLNGLTWKIRQMLLITYLTHPLHCCQTIKRPQPQ